MRCILEGHKPVSVAGQGDLKDRTLVLCLHCGRVLEEPSGGYSAAAQQAAFERMAEARR